MTTLHEGKKIHTELINHPSLLLATYGLLFCDCDDESLYSHVTVMSL